MKTPSFALFFFFFGLFLHTPAFALKTSPNALRLEDSKSGNIVLGADHAVLEAGEVYKSIVVLWGDFQVYGQAEEVILLSGKVKFHPGSKLLKNLVVIGGDFEVLPGAEVSGDKVAFKADGPFWNIVRTFGNFWRNYYEGTAKIIASLSFCLLFWISGLLIFTFSPKLKTKTVDVLWVNWAKNLLAGILGSILVPALLVLLVFSIVGILMLPFYFILLAIAAHISYLVAALWVGQRILPPKNTQKIHPIGFLLGIVILQLLWHSGLVMGILLVVFIWTLAWGSLVRTAKAIF